MALQRTHWFGVKACKVGLPQPVQIRIDFRFGVTRRAVFFGSLEDIISRGATWLIEGSKSDWTDY